MGRIVIRMTRCARRRLEKRARSTRDSHLRVRIQIVLLYAGGSGCKRVAASLGIAPSHAIKTARRFLQHGLEGLEDRRRENGNRKVDEDLCQKLHEILSRAPEDFGWQRPTWTRELLAWTMERETGVRVSVTTVSTMLSKIGARWGMARPTVFCPWPEPRKKRRMKAIWRAVTNLPGDEMAFYEDEVDIHLNPKIGRDWMLPGEQTLIMTPGKNEKRYIAGALSVDGRELVTVTSRRKDTAIFVDLLKRLRSTHPHLRRVHLILDNYSIHSSRILQRYLETQKGFFVLHFLPPYSPDENKIERLWRDLHANVTRNHRCKSIDDLMERVRGYLGRETRRRRRHATKVNEEHEMAA